jgi:magnesium transporter
MSNQVPLDRRPVTGTVVHSLTAGEVHRHDPAELPDLLAGDALVWVDVATCDEPARRMLADAFGFHSMAVEDSARRNPVPKVHLYRDHVFVVLHAPERGAGGHVHTLELDQFVGERFLVTVHGPTSDVVDARTALADTDAVLDRLVTGRAQPTSGAELSAAVIGAVIRRLLRHLEELTAETWELERKVTGGHFGDAEGFLEEMFRVRHGLLTLATMATLDHEVYGRATRLRAFAAESDHLAATDIVDQLDRIATMAEAQKTYLQGVIEFYQTRTNTKMTVAAERLAVIAGVTLPVTALSSILGMNVIVSTETNWGWLIVLLIAMAAMSTLMLVWARRKGWW